MTPEAGGAAGRRWAEAAFWLRPVAAFFLFPYRLPLLTEIDLE